MATDRGLLLGFWIPDSTRSQSSNVLWVCCWREVIAIRRRKGAHAASNACSASEADRKRVVENPCSDTHSCLPRQVLHLQVCQRLKAAHRNLLLGCPHVLSAPRVIARPPVLSAARVKNSRPFLRSAVGLQNSRRSWLFLVGPGIPNVFPVVIPFTIRIGSLPVALQFVFQLVIPFGIFFAVM